MATVSKTVSLVGYRFDEGDIDKVVAAIDAPSKVQREALAAKRDLIEAKLWPKAKSRKKDPADNSWRLELELQPLEREIERLLLEITATNVWGEEFKVHSLDELWGYIGRNELRKLEMRSHQLMGDEFLSIAFALDLEGNSNYGNYIRTSGPVGEVRSVGSNIDNVIKRRQRWWLTAGNKWFVQLIVATVLWAVLTIESYSGLRHVFTDGLAASIAAYGSIAVVGLLIAPPVRLFQMLAPAAIVNGWGRFEPRRINLRYASGAVAFALIATLIWTIVQLR